MILFLIALGILLLASAYLFSLGPNVSKALVIVALVISILLMLQAFGVLTLHADRM